MLYKRVYTLTIKSEFLEKSDEFLKDTSTKMIHEEKFYITTCSILWLCCDTATTCDCILPWSNITPCIFYIYLCICIYYSSHVPFFTAFSDILHNISYLFYPTWGKVENNHQHRPSTVISIFLRWKVRFVMLFISKPLSESAIVVESIFRHT